MNFIKKGIYFIVLSLVFSVSLLAMEDENENLSQGKFLIKFAANNSNADSAKRNINSSLLGFNIEKIEFLGEGFNNTAAIVNDEFVFRFPKRNEVSESLSTEIKILPLLAKRLKIAIPEFIYFGKQEENGFNFVGYRKIPGTALTKELFLDLPISAKENIFITLSDFLQNVHSFPVEQAKKLGVTEEDFSNTYKEYWDETKEKIFPLLGREFQEKLGEFFQNYLSDDSNFKYEPSLLYADFSPEHILFDTEVKRIRGIIDWGDLTVGDPDYDLMYLYQNYGDEFIRSFLNYYPHNNAKKLIEKLKFFSICDEIDTIISFGQKLGQTENIEPALSELKKKLIIWSRT